MPKAMTIDCLHKDHTVSYCFVPSKISFEQVAHEKMREKRLAERQAKHRRPFFAPSFFRTKPQLIQRVEEAIDSLYLLLFRSDMRRYWLHHWPVRKRIEMQLTKSVP